MKKQVEVIHKKTGGGGGAVYGLGLIGSLFYYLQNSTDFVSGLVGVLKSIVWPAFLVYDLSIFLGL